MKQTTILLILCSSTLALFGWEPEPKLSLEGVLKTVQRECTRHHPDGKEEKWIEKSAVLITDEPITLSRSISIGNKQPLIQQKSIPFLKLSLSEEFDSLMGKRVEVQGQVMNPYNFFILDDFEFDVDTALDIEWLRTHPTKTVLYEPSVVVLQGTLYKKTYPGPPEYASIEMGDAPETVLILALAEPVDVELEHEEKEVFNQPEKGVREVHVVFTESYPPEELWTQGITAKGTLFSAITGHHRRRVVMLANAWEASNNPKQ